MKSITVLKMKIHEAPDDLEDIAVACRRGRNASVENWLLRKRGKKESQKQAGKGRNGGEKTESTKLYHAITEAVPDLGTQIVSCLANQVYANLSARIDWREDKSENGKRQRKCDLILSHEYRIPSYNDLSVPIVNKHCTMLFSDTLVLTVRELWRQKPARFSMSLKGVPTGIKRILHDLSSGERKLSDSRILRRRNNHWYWFVPVTFEVELENDKVAILEPVIAAEENGESDRPFALRCPGKKPWYIGDGRYLRYQAVRFEGIRKQIGWRYRQRHGAGHGRQKVDQAIRLRRQQFSNIVDEVRRRMIVDVIRQCERHKCGRLEYREPTNPVKELCWFEANRLTWDWTRFVGDMKNALARKGIELTTRKLKMAEVKKNEKRD